MAMTINSSPVLRGEYARAFVEEAERNGKPPTPRLSPKRKNSDLNEFFSKDAFLYETELLGKTYAWINTADPSKILGLVTLANDSVKAQFITNSIVLNAFL